MTREDIVRRVKAINEDNRDRIDLLMSSADELAHWRVGWNDVVTNLICIALGVNEGNDEGEDT